ncbi:APC family permease [Rhodococcus sp. BP-349]|uniref:APC family permease n=1 Tax=unclassified Rhodococcus (in: high G+C Gram-positive bacteria) TaxID=192944 RepID=UPI001C9B689E|nr:MULTISPECIES: APC family permease [unclassified Rhodococcus (in: high G+C Gram-positive bacteria)]MBY6539283.1 APC family permease [Rhodococcus sp. BP-363]MBY6544389.1 APC family permease [Rhodococcus sp. BP-369]MBY6563619.1 APC family permease [Rhodococcus sp. BP-370]MBY6577911.1 APC family permease [Rhodococcus sp. BP-364]MBY6587212.1 APC family permease [Rhodococcus sp. BP-358]
MPLQRRLTTRDAVVIGVGSMVGAGVFSAFGPAAAAAGGGLLFGLAVAAVVAFCNATSTAQLAAVHPTSGGSYAYGRARLGDRWGFLAGWSFVVGKTASCAAMALTFGAYAWPEHARALAVIAVVALAAVNCLGITRTASVTRVLVAVVLVVLAAALIVGATGSSTVTGAGFSATSGPVGVLQSAGILFFAFAGYARIATLGEEVRDPARTIPRAVVGALACAVVIYAAVAVMLLHVLGADALARSTAPVAAAMDAVGAHWAGPVVRVGASAAALGALLGLIAGIGRTTMAMAREGDMPRYLAHVDERRSVPRAAEITVAAVVVVVVLTLDVRNAIGFSSFGVLVYYAVANAAAFTQTGSDRRWPRALQILGLCGCVLLAVTLPAAAVVVGIGVLSAGSAGRWMLQRRRSLQS